MSNMADPLQKLRELLSNDPRTAVLLTELLGTPIGMRPQNSPDTPA